MVVPDVVVVAAVHVVLQVALQVMVPAKIRTDALSVSYAPGAQVKRSSGVHKEKVPTCAVSRCS